MELLGIDIGGTGIKGAVVETTTGEFVTDRIRIETPQPATPKAVIDTVHKLVKEFGWKKEIGCGFPAAVKHEIVKTASNIDNSWLGINAGQEIEKVTGCRTHVVNDVDAAGYAEVNLGEGKDIPGTVIVVAFGTGIGSAIFVDGKLVPNTELGHLVVKDKNLIAEHWTSNSAREKQELSWDKFGKRVNKYLKMLEFYFWPDLIILGGGVSKQYSQFKHKIELETKVLPATLRNKAGIVGAAIAAVEEFNLDK